jgi:Ca2+-binding RTX toxin-like protein
MASIPGSHYDVFAGSQTVNFGVTSDPNNVPAPVPGDFNLEVVTSASGTDSFTTAPGYQGLAILSADGHTLTPLHGDFGVVDAGGSDSIVAGDGNLLIGGAPGDTIIGGTGNQFLDAHRGNQLVVGGNAGNETIFSGIGDTILGGAGNETIGGVAGDTITGGTGNYFIDADLGNQSIVGGSGGNGTIWGGAGDTIQGGAGNVTIGGMVGDTIIGGSGNALIDGHLGNQSITGGSGNTTIWGGAGDTIQGASGTGSALIGFAGGNQTLWDNGSTSNGSDSIFGFSQASGDRISLDNATDTAASVLATASADGSGNAVVHLSDGSSVTLLGVSVASLNSSFFTSH